MSTFQRLRQLAHRDLDRGERGRFVSNKMHLPAWRMPNRLWDWLGVAVFAVVVATMAITFLVEWR